MRNYQLGPLSPVGGRADLNLTMVGGKNETSFHKYEPVAHDHPPLRPQHADFPLCCLDVELKSREQTVGNLEIFPATECQRPFRSIDRFRFLFSEGQK